MFIINALHLKSNIGISIIYCITFWIGFWKRYSVNGAVTLVVLIIIIFIGGSSISIQFK